MATVKINFPEPLERFYFFNEDQVLTAGQLNQLAGHFDHEHRLTRTKALGIGIVCGLEARLGEGEIHLSKGAAITSAGDLLQVGAGKIFTHFRLLQDESTVAEEEAIRIRRLGDEEATVTMWQLFESNVDGSTPLSDFQGNASLNDLVLVLYLDSYLKEPENCTDTNCDNGGVTQMNELLAVLVPKQLLSPPLHSPNRYAGMANVTIRRANLGGSTITGLTDLVNRYEEAVTGSLPQLVLAVNLIAEQFPDLLEAAFGEANPAAKWAVRLRQIATAQTDQPSIQYVYDFFRDLADAINEFREAVRELPGACCPPSDLFSKYVMAGELAQASGLRYPQYRHYFIESPLVRHGDRRNAKAVSLLRRLGLMISTFEPEPQLANRAGRIRITPSRQGQASLGERAIPFYYNLSQRQPLHEFWHFEKTEHGLAESHQGYHMRELSQQAEVRQPFDFADGKSDFFRVEGLLGLPVDEAEKQLEGLVQQHNLPFKIETIQIEDEVEKVRPKRPFFPDLDILFRHYREELDSNLTLVRDFNVKLKNEFVKTENTVEAEFRETDNAEAFAELKVAATQETEEFENRLQSVRTMMYQPLESFATNFTSFRESYDRTVQKGHTINEKVHFSAQAVTNTPIQKLVQDNGFRKFDHLVEAFHDRLTLLRRQYIFDKFQNNNPGLEHRAGVSTGGTFVLAYSTTTDRVVGDFCLPYCCVVEVKETAPKPLPPLRPIPGVFVPNIPWIQKLKPIPIPRIPLGTLRLDSLVQEKINVASATYFEGAFNTKIVEALPKIFQTPGTTTGGGLTDPGNVVVVGGLRDVGKGIEDDDLRIDVERVARDSERVKYLNAIPAGKRTDAEQAELARLTNELPNRAKELIERVGGGTEDISLGSDGHRALEGVAVVMAETKELADFKVATEAANSVLSSSVANSNFNKAGGLTRILGAGRRFG